MRVAAVLAVAALSLDRAGAFVVPLFSDTEYPQMACIDATGNFNDTLTAMLCHTGKDGWEGSVHMSDEKTYQYADANLKARFCKAETGFFISWYFPAKDARGLCRTVAEDDKADSCGIWGEVVGKVKKPQDSCPRVNPKPAAAAAAA